MIIKTGLLMMIVCFGFLAGTQAESLEENLFRQLKVADKLVETKQYEKALTCYLDCLETGHRLSSKMIGPVSVNLSFMAGVYSEGRVRVGAYLRKRVDSALRGELNEAQMKGLNVLAEAYELEPLLTDSFPRVMAVQRVKGRQLAWGGVAYKAMCRAKKHTELARYFDMAEYAKMRLQGVKKTIENNRAVDRDLVGLGLRRLKKEILEYRSVYEILGDRGRVVAIDGQLEELGKILRQDV